jgi:hypothetical protein
MKGIVHLSPVAHLLQVTHVLGNEDIPRLSNYELMEIEKAVFEISRKQKMQIIPVDLPRENFWSAVRQLLYHLDTECAETIRKEGGQTTKSQLQSRRLNTLRTCINDTTRLRLNAFAQHAILSNLIKTQKIAHRTSGSLHKIDWKRHDPAERKFYNGMINFTEKYKMDVQWDGLLHGPDSVIEEIKESNNHINLIEFNDEKVVVYDEEVIPKKNLEFNKEWEEPEYDEEDRIREIEKFPYQISHIPPKDDLSEINNSSEPELKRIKIVQDLNDPIISEDGTELLLNAGDIESCSALIADTLIAAGLAEPAPV